jgi:anti-anti-sigma regulatory factor
LVSENALVTADLGDATFIDSSFMHSLVKAGRAARDHGTGFNVQLGTTPAIEQALRVGGLLEQLNCLPPQEQTMLPPVPPPESFTQVVSV